jgi:hypothetical protein
MKCPNPQCQRTLTADHLIHETRWRCPDSTHTKPYLTPGVCKIPSCRQTLKQRPLPKGYLCPACGTITP